MASLSPASRRKKSRGGKSRPRLTGEEFHRAWSQASRKRYSSIPDAKPGGFGAHVAMVRIDRETGKPTIEKLVLVDDCGVIINPMIVEGQVHGGVAQGLGEALREQMLFGEDGQVLTGTLMNYAVMRAGDMPQLTLGETVTPNPFNPLGVKGVGEAGTNGAPPAVANAMMDALAPLGIDHIDMPYTAPKLWEAISGKRREDRNEIVKHNRFPRSSLHPRSDSFSYARPQDMENGGVSFLQLGPPFPLMGKGWG